MGEKKGVSGWFWIIGGLLVSAVFIVMAFQFLGSMTDASLRQSALTTYGNLGSWIKTACLNERGYAVTKKITLPEAVVAVYASDGAKGPPVKVSTLIRDKKSFRGNYYCMQMSPINEERPSCQKIDCIINMTYMGSLPETMDIFSMVANILGERPVFSYAVRIEKTGHDEVTVAAKREAEI